MSNPLPIQCTVQNTFSSVKSVYMCHNCVKQYKVQKKRECVTKQDAFYTFQRLQKQI